MSELDPIAVFTAALQEADDSDLKKLTLALASGINNFNRYAKDGVGRCSTACRKDFQDMKVLSNIMRKKVMDLRKAGGAEKKKPEAPAAPKA
jgi:hypothetical protein